MIAKISLAINIIMIFAVAYLFSVDHSNNNDGVKRVSERTASAQHDSIQSEDLVIGVVRGDSIMLKYLFVADEQDRLMSKSKVSEAKIRKRIGENQTEYEELVRYAETAPESDLPIIQNRVMELEQEINQLQQEESQKIATIEQEFQVELGKKISRYLKGYCKENGIDFIMNYEPNNLFLLYSDEVHDVTAPVLEGLNADYLKSKESKE